MTSYTPTPSDPAGQQPHSAVPPQPYGAVSQPYPGGGYPVAPMPAPTNTMAIVALIGGLLLPLLGIIAGHISLNQIKRTGEQGRGMAIVGLILGYAFTAFGVLYFVIWIIMMLAFGGAMMGASTM